MFYKNIYTSIFKFMNKNHLILSKTVCKNWQKWINELLPKYVICFADLTDCLDISLIDYIYIHYQPTNLFNGLVSKKWLNKDKQANCAQYIFLKSSESFGEEPFQRAALGGNIKVLKWLKFNNCPMTDKAFVNAAKNGSMEVMKWFVEIRCYWNENVFYEAAKHDDLELIK